MPMQAVRDLDNKSLKIYSKGGNAHIEELTVYEVKSIWPEVSTEQQQVFLLQLSYVSAQLVHLLLNANSDLTRSI
jgi:hypothetical protein